MGGLGIYSIGTQIGSHANEREIDFYIVYPLYIQIKIDRADNVHCLLDVTPEVERTKKRGRERRRDVYLYMVDAAFFFGDFITRQTWRRPKTPKLNDRHLWQVPKKKNDTTTCITRLIHVCWSVLGGFVYCMLQITATPPRRARKNNNHKIYKAG